MTFPSWLPAEQSWNPTNSEYHGSGQWWGSTMLKDFRRSPALAFRRYVAKDLERPSPTASMILGSLAHLLILEPQNYDREVVVVDVRGKTAKAFKAAERDNPEKLVVTAPEHLAALSMADSVKRPQTQAAEIAHALFNDWPAAAEYSFRWHDELGVPCKVRFDWLTETAHGPAMVNLKTSADASPEGFMRQAFSLEYHAQQAFYERGFVRLTGRVPDALLVVIHNEPPYEVSVKQPSEEFLELGRRQIKADLAALAKALEHPDRGKWAAPWETGIESLDLPPWARLKVERSTYDTF